MPIIKVTAKTDRFRRAGFSFTREPVELNTDDLSKEQLKMLKAESMLVIEEVSSKDKDKDKDKDKTNAGGSTTTGSK